MSTPQPGSGPGSGTGQYWTADPAVTPDRREVRVRIAGEPYVFTTAAGTFSADRLDAGTSLLLDRGPAPVGATLLDLGCGWGPVAVSLARRVPAATVWAVDVNRRALELSRANADRAGVGARVRVAEPDGVPAAITFEAIWSNPPIRVGKADLHALLLAWLPRLAPGGVAHLVVARNLGADSLAAWLGDRGWPTVRAGSAKGYRLLDVPARGNGIGTAGAQEVGG